MKLAVTQEHGSMEGRSIVRENTVAGYQKDPDFAPAHYLMGLLLRDENQLAAAKIHLDRHANLTGRTGE